MNLSELTENSGKQLVIIYPGRFHPFHIGHGKVYKYLKQKYSNAKVFISTSGKVDGDRSPFTFDEKKKMMMLAGVDGSAIVQTKSPYQSVEIMERFDQNTTVMVFAVSEKDMAEDPRFDFSGGIKLKKNGEPAYLQKWNGLEDAETFGTRGYIATTPTFPFEVLGQKINSASQIRNMIVNSDDTKLTQMLQDLYNITDVPQDVIELFKTKIGNKDAMNENWDEDSFSKFLTENVIEENTMKRNILQAISEGKSPHKKGTKKYNAHMAAMHAESIDEEFDKKVEEVMELKKTNEWVQDSPAQGFSGQERNFIQELCLRMDGVSKSPEGLKWMGKSKTWDEGNVLSDKGKLTTVMLWAKKNIGDLYDKMGSEFKVYSDGNDIIGRSGRGQSDGNQIMQNIIKKIGKIGEPMKTNEEQLDEILPALGVAAAAGAVGTAAYKGGKALHKWMSNKNSKMPGSGMAKDAETALSNRKTQMNKNLGTLKNESESKERPYIVFHATKGSYQTHATSSYDAAKNAAKYWKLKSTAGITPKLADVEHVAENAYHNEQHEMLEYIHHVLQECGDGNMDITMVEQALEYVEEIREQHFDDEGNTKSEGVNEAGGYYTQPVYDMIKQHGYSKVMHELLSSLDADVIQNFINRADFEESVEINEDHNIGILKAVARQMEADAHNGDFTAIDELLQNVSEEEMKAFLSDHRSSNEWPEESVNEAPDHEVSMARKDVSRLAKYSSELEQMLSNVSEEEGLQGWVQAKITKAADYISSVKHYMEAATIDEAKLDEFGPDERYIRTGNTITYANSKTGSVRSNLNLGGDKNVRVNNHFNADGSQGQVKASGTVGGMKFKASNQVNGKTPKASVNGVNILPVNASKKPKVNEAPMSGDYANVYYDYSESFYMIDVYKDDKKVEEYDDYIGAMEEGNPIKDKFLELVKKAGLEPEGLNLISTGGDEPDEYGVFKNGKFNWDKNSEVTEDTIDVTPAGYGPDDYDEKDVPPEAHNGDLEMMQDSYKYNEDRNNHSENILMLAQAFGDRGEIKAVEGLLKIIKRQGYTTPEQSDMMYKAIHKKYYKQLFPETEAEGNKFSGELEKAKIDGKKSFDVDGKTYKVKEALSKLLDSQKTNEAGIMHYSDAKGTTEYKEGQKAAKNGEPYDSNPYSGAEKLRWSKGHNEWRHANKRKKGEPNFGAKGQFEGKK
jgi:glycerol-3-phosphate cytidylyltransferase-like family protein